MQLGSVELYIGGTVEYESERLALEQIVRVLSPAPRTTVVLANVHLRSRQVDLVVGRDDLLVVLEVKGFTRAVRGGFNGAWETQLGTGWKPVRNGYQQALSASHAVKDELAELGEVVSSYPRAAVVFVPGVPHGSELQPGDFKVALVDIEQLKGFLAENHGERWSTTDLRQMATKLRLRRVSTVDEACDERLGEAANLITQYAEDFTRTYEAANRLVPFECRCANGDVVSSSDVCRMVARDKVDLVLQGGSGRGKSMLAGQCGVEFLRGGGVALVLSVREYDRDVKSVLDREARLLSAPSAAAVLRAARRLRRPILFVVDGYNECAVERRGSLTRRIAALTRMYEAGLLVTSRVVLARGDLLPIKTIEVPPFSMEAKLTIAEGEAGTDTSTEELSGLLESVSSGLEARLIGEVAAELGTVGGRHRVFDAYARRRLGNRASEGIRTAAHIAGWLIDRLAFSANLQELARMLSADGLSEESADLLEQEEFLARRGGKVSFSHEMFLDAFAAESIVRSAGGRAEPILAAIREPVNAGRKELILGAVEERTLRALLLRLDDPECVRACLSGTCGQAAREWAEALCVDIFERMGDEARQVRFRVNREHQGIEFDGETVAELNAWERALLAVLPELVWEGKWLEEFFEHVGTMDGRIVEEAGRLEAKGYSKPGVRDRLFETSYVLGGPTNPRISAVVQVLQTGVLGLVEGRSPTRTKVATIVGERGLDGLSPGQIFLILHLCRWNEPERGFVARAIKERWSSAPYHLRLELLAAARFARQESDDDRHELVNALNALPDQGMWLGSMVVDALKAHGALDEEEEAHLDSAREEVNRCLAEAGERSCSDALRLYTFQFDHPYSGAYWDVIHDLPKDERRRLLSMAAEGAERGSWCIDMLLVELVAFADPKLGDHLRRWTEPPPRDSKQLWDTLRPFQLAHVGLARLGIELPAWDDEREPPELALAAYGVLLYWINRSDLDRSDQNARCEMALGILQSDAGHVALDVMKACELSGPRGLPGVSDQQPPVVWGVRDRFGDSLVGVCRRALRQPDEQKGYFKQFFFDRDRQSCLRMAFDVLSIHGNSADSELLRRYASDACLGESAIRAMRVLGERASSSRGFSW